MKFTEGMWAVREGVDINWMSHVERVKVSDDQVSLLLTKSTGGRGDKLNNGTLQALVTSPLAGVVAVNFTHWDGANDTGPHFPLNVSKANVDIQTQHGESLKFVSDPLHLDVNIAANKLAFEYQTAGEMLTGHSFRSIGFVQDSNPPIYNSRGDIYSQRDNYMLLELDLSVHEKIYGLGERFGPFIKNGQQVDIWNEDGGTSSELTYKNIPFFISSRGYGVFVNNPAKVMFEIQSERTTRINITIKAESLEYMIIAGPTPKEILYRYTALTGRPSLPPAWSYGLWLTTSFTTSYDEKTVTGFLDGFKERDIPLSTFHFDAYWMKSYQWCDFTFDDDFFPDALGYLKRLKERGFRICVWMNPYVGQASPLFLEGKKKGYFLMRSDTAVPTVWQWDLWQPGMAIVDFTNPAACKWFASHLRHLMEMGIDAFKTDFGERIPFDPKQVKYYDGSDTIRMHNFYPFLYNKCVFETMKDFGKDPCLFARSATTGCQQFPVHWGGDCESTFEAMAETLRGGLSLALSGFAFWAHDIGGFEGLPHPILYKRWVQFGLLGSHSRLHGSSSFRVPWIYQDSHPGEAEKCSKVLRDCVLLKLSLMPYLLRVALEAKEKGTPMMRAMFVEYQQDMNVWQLDMQYMLGPDLLVAPIFSHDGKVSFYVPRSNSSAKGDAKWRSWFDHTKTYEEGRWYTEIHDFETLPLLVRPGAVIPFNPNMSTPEADFLPGLKVLVNGPLDEKAKVELVVADDVAKIGHTFIVSTDLEVQDAEVNIISMAR